MILRNGKYCGFKRSEFACHCGCGFDAVDNELLDVLIQAKIDHKGAVIRINSGCRCAEHNYNIGGSNNSQHIIAKACDIVIVGYSADRVYNYFNDKYKNRYGVGKYHNRTHIDVRAKKARWEVLNG